MEENLADTVINDCYPSLSHAALAQAHRINAVIAIVSSPSRPDSAGTADAADASEDTDTTTANAPPAQANSVAIVPYTGGGPRAKPDALAVSALL